MSNVPMTLPDLMIKEHKTNWFHDSTFTELSDGRILHSAARQFTSSEDRGMNWSAPFKAHDQAGNRVGPMTESSLVRLSGKGIGLGGRVYDKDNPSSIARAKSNHMVFWRSDDGGETWEEPVDITEPGTQTSGYQDTFLRTSSGRIVLPVCVGMGHRKAADIEANFSSGKLVNGHWAGSGAHFWDPAMCGCFVCFSDDDGRTWKRNEDGELFVHLSEPGSYSYTVEPSVTEVYPDRMLMIMRTCMGRLYQAWSDDNGETWTGAQPTSLAASTAPGQIRILPNGHLLIVWNQEGEEDIKLGYNRHRISSAVSRNGGGVWEFFQNVESLFEETRVEPGRIEHTAPAEVHLPPGYPAPARDPRYIESAAEYGRWSYPSVLVLEDRVLIAHTYTKYSRHPIKAQLVSNKDQVNSFNQKLKVLPLKWFYGGKEPADNPFLPRAYEPAQP